MEVAAELTMLDVDDAVTGIDVDPELLRQLQAI